jgi:hypothetical protein
LIFKDKKVLMRDVGHGLCPFVKNTDTVFPGMASGSHQPQNTLKSI